LTRHLPGRISLTIVTCVALLLGLALPAAAANPSVLATVTATSFSATETVARTGQVGTYNGACNPLPCTASIDWGDGSTVGAGTVTGTAGNWVISGSYTYPEDGTFTTHVTVNDNALSPVSAAGTATVAERLIVVAGQGTITGPREGVSFTGTVATFTDAGSTDPASSFTASITWGDGTTGGNGGVITSTGAGSYSVAGTHAYADEGTFTITVYVNEAGSGQASATTAITIAEADALTQGTPLTITGTEGTALPTTILGTFTDAYAGDHSADFIAAVDWGDNNSSGGSTNITYSAGTYTVTGSQTYFDEGTYSVRIYIYEGPPTYTLLLTLTATAVIAEADVLTGQPANFSATEGLAFSNVVVATFTDPYTSSLGQTASDFTASVNWGDGSSSAGTVSLTGGTFTVRGDHTYADNGSFTVTVTLTDDTPGTATGTATSTATVAGIDSFTGSAVGPLTGQEGTPFSGTIATFTDTNTAVQASDLIATIDWGDGTTSAGTVSAVSGVITVSASHVYDEGSFTYRVTLADDAPGGASATVQSTAVYTEAPLSGSVTAPFNAIAGKPFTDVLVGTFIDQGGKEAITEYAARISWGDGTTTDGKVVDPPGTIHVFGSHTYATTGTFTVTVTLTDLGGATASATTSASVAAATPGTPGPARPLPVVPVLLLILGLGIGGAALTVGRRRRA